MLQSTVLSNWENGIPSEIPKTVKNRFQWNTSVLKNGGNCDYNESFRIDVNLPETQDITPFQEYITKSKNKYAVAFPNLTGDTMLVIPIPKRGKNYATLWDFMKNSSITQQREFWKKVAEVARNYMGEYGKVWVSVHGLGVAYTHIRISNKPKYYFDNSLKKE